jgi:hypothetical protein
MGDGSQGTVAGILLRRNGEVFFIPDAQLDSFRVPDDAISRAQQMASESSEVVGHSHEDEEAVVIGTLQVPTGVARGQENLW